MKKIHILFYAWFGKDWMGGMYYIRNMIFGLVQNQEIMKQVQIFILTDRDYETEFADFLDVPGITVLYRNEYSVFYKIYLSAKSFCYNHLRKIRAHKDLLAVVRKYHIDYIYPMCLPDDVYREKGVMWIPDLQHMHYPEFFPETVLADREKQYRYLAQNHSKMILSSQSVLKDYKTAYPQYTKNVFVVPFVSALKESHIYDDQVEKCCQKYHIPKKYFMVSNQYWKHKNHKVVFEAIHIIKEQHNAEIQIVSTGLMQDDRDKAYISELKEMIDEYELQDNILQLGLISREDQIQIMKGALAVIQPSLFEGWGTVVEDAKTLQKRIVLSDIDVHKEQANADCVFFERYNAGQLADILLGIWQEEEPYVSKANYDYKKQAAEYGKLFYEALIAK
jgi:glycosyltransferase involved in cell wall biosynthesis